MKFKPGHKDHAGVGEGEPSLQKQPFVMWVVILDRIHRRRKCGVEQDHAPSAAFSTDLCWGAPQSRWVLTSLGQCTCCHGRPRGMLPQKPETDGQKLTARGGSGRIYRMFSLAERTAGGKVICIRPGPQGHQAQEEQKK